MAAQKSTASQTPRKRKATKPDGKRIKPPQPQPQQKRIETIPVWVVVGPEGDEVVYLSADEAESYADTRSKSARIDERAAVIVDHKAQRITSKECYGVMIGDRLVSTHADSGDACKAMGTGYVVRLLLNDAESREAERPAERRRMLRQTNPLAAKLASEHSYVLYAVGEELGDLAELHEPSGVAIRRGKDNIMQGVRRATDEEAVLCDLHLGKSYSIDVRGDVPGQVVKKLTAFIKRLQKTVERMKLSKRQGIFDPPEDDQADTGKAVTA